MSPDFWRRILLIGACTILVTIGAFVAGRVSVGTVAEPSTTSAAAGFARDMQVHHDQGVELAMIIRDLSGDEQIRTLAYDIATSQARQAGQMYGWLEVWGIPQASPEDPMTWMTRPPLGESVTHAHDEDPHEPGQPMPGLATLEQVTQLKSLGGSEADSYFLELMIAHHEGAVVMAKAALDRTEVPVVLELAASIVKSQGSEIEYMEALYGRLSAEPGR